MKRYLVFVYDNCYPVGGIYDVETSFDAESEAIVFAEQHLDEHKDVNGRAPDHLYIFDILSREVIWKGGRFD